jgi:hypothetical protein
MDMNQMGMMGMPQMMGMDPNMMGGNMQEMPMGMNMFSGGYPGMNPNQMPGAPQGGQNPNAQQGGNINNTSQ